MNWMDMYGIGQIAALAIFDYLEKNELSPRRFVDSLKDEEGCRMFEDGLRSMLGEKLSDYIERHDAHAIGYKLRDPVYIGNWLGERIANKDEYAGGVLEAFEAGFNNGDREYVNDFLCGLFKGYKKVLEEAKISSEE